MSVGHLKMFCYYINLLLCLMIPKFTSGQQTRTFVEAVEQYSQLGLRTLCLAWREVEEDEYQEWSLMFKEASSTLIDREVKGILLTVITCKFC